MPDEIVLNTGINHRASTLSLMDGPCRACRQGDEIILSVMEHHANIVPWHFLRERQGVVLKWVDVDETGYLDPQAVIDAISDKTKLIAVTHMSNVLGHAG
jgi:cysteine desulfurase/selenocysteine lyase